MLGCRVRFKAAGSGEVLQGKVIRELFHPGLEHGKLARHWIEIETDQGPVMLFEGRETGDWSGVWREKLTCHAYALAHYATA